MPICALVLFGVIFSIWLKYSAAGRQIYAVGGNAEAARLSGIPVRSVTLGVFVLNGLLVGISAILYATNFTAIQSNVAPGFELTVITSAVIGGVSILGGTGTVIGALLGGDPSSHHRHGARLPAYSCGMVSNGPRQPDSPDYPPGCFPAQANVGCFDLIGRSRRRRRRGCFAEIPEPSMADGSGSRADRHPDRRGHRFVVYI